MPNRTLLVALLLVLPAVCSPSTTRADPAFDAIKPLAEQGDAAAQNDLGRAYDDGKGVPQNHGEAVKWYRKAAEQGLATAQFNLGAMYWEGTGVPQNYAEAVKLYRNAAAQGIIKANFNLGVAYEQGRGVSQDYGKAAYWYRQPAELGYPEAQVNLGNLYYRGEGVPQDYVRAHMWFNLAAAQQGGLAAKNRDVVGAKMTAEQIAEAQRLAHEWKPKTERGGVE